MLDRETGRIESRPQVGLRLRLSFEVDGQDLVRLCSLPWELLYDPRENGRRSQPIVRSIAVPRPARPLTFAEPLRVLAVASRPSGLPALSLDQEQRTLVQSWTLEPRVELTVLDTPTPHELRRVLLKRNFQILHFMGHGTLEAKNGEGSLVLGSFSNEPRLVTGEELALLLRDASSLRMVVLDACHTSRLPAGEVNPFAGVATALIKNGLAAVLAMQLPISDRAALAFNHTFYQRLAAGEPVEVAVGEGRLAIARADPQERAMPGLYLPNSERLVDAARQERDRYAELVDKKFQSPLTVSEQAELLRLQEYLDEADAKFYEPIEEKLESVLTKLRQRSQAR
ncbi:MAG: CHAT domain-containing protein [Acidobacteria bacterium]|nr:CHAT domain-containing protein [Acidobacteriota bacterium]